MQTTNVPNKGALALCVAFAAAGLRSAPASAAPYTFTFNDEFGIVTTTHPIPGETAAAYATQVFGTNCVWSSPSMSGCGVVPNTENFYIYQGNGLPLPATGATTDPSTRI